MLCTNGVVDADFSLDASARGIFQYIPYIIASKVKCMWWFKVADPIAIKHFFNLKHWQILQLPVINTLTFNFIIRRLGMPRDWLNGESSSISPLTSHHIPRSLNKELDSSPTRIVCSGSFLGLHPRLAQSHACASDNSCPCSTTINPGVWIWLSSIPPFYSPRKVSRIRSSACSLIIQYCMLAGWVLWWSLS